MAADKTEKTEVRIIAGSLRGRKIVCKVHAAMRPTPQMVREALFSILGNAVPGRPFYDVFAGTGVVGLEAVSRGASRVTLLEKDARQAADIQKSITHFEVDRVAHVVRADAYRWAERWIPPLDGGPVSVFLSPPFPDLHAERAEAFLKLIADLQTKMPRESVLVIQAEDGFPADKLADLPLWDHRRYGRNHLYFRVIGEEAAATSEPT